MLFDDFFENETINLSMNMDNLFGYDYFYENKKGEFWFHASER